jgi:hypothetical protein
LITSCTVNVNMQIRRWWVLTAGVVCAPAQHIGQISQRQARSWDLFVMAVWPAQHCRPQQGSRTSTTTTQHALTTSPVIAQLKKHCNKCPQHSSMRTGLTGHLCWSVTATAPPNCVVQRYRRCRSRSWPAAAGHEVVKTNSAHSRLSRGTGCAVHLRVKVCICSCGQTVPCALIQAHQHTAMMWSTS